MVEFRLYYDDNGRVLCYTCENLEGNYIVIDSDTYHQCRPDNYVIDGKIVNRNEITIVTKLKPSDKGTLCSNEDISMIALDGTRWELTTNEFRHY